MYVLFRASFLFFLHFYFYSIFAECRGGETGNSSSRDRGLITTSCMFLREETCSDCSGVGGGEVSQYQVEEEFDIRVRLELIAKFYVHNELLLCSLFF